VSTLHSLLEYKINGFSASPSFSKVSGFPKVPVNYKPVPHFEYSFLQFPPSSEPQVIETDVIIIGSGCGGGVCAKNLSEAGHKVLVVDKSYYYPPSAFPMTEVAGGVHLLENGGADTSDTGCISIISGSCWGGGGTVNWSASLQPQSFVREEWANDRKLPFFASSSFQDSLDRVCTRMGVSDKHIRHNHGNNALIEGSRKLGMACKNVPQNTGGNEHYCGYCTMGCGAAQKQGPVVTWLPDAANAGALFAEGFEAKKVLFETVDGKKTATGVQGIWTSRNSSGGVDGPKSGRTIREVIVKAKRVIVSAGTLWSPVILLNSGLTNPQIGRNLYLHPVNVVVGVYPEDVRPWEGGILTSVNTSLENLDGHGHGVKLETAVMLPSFALTFLNWTSGLDFKLAALKFRHMNNFIAIARDRDTGRVYRSPDNTPAISYSPSPFDRAHCLTGAIALCRIALASGASEIHVAIQDTPPFIVGDEPDVASSPRFRDWLAAIEKAGNAPPKGTYPCAHQMGSNRMSATAKTGVVDPQGKVWGTEGLFVSDASVFPSASGVNPMVTNMAISDYISRGISKDLSGDRARL
jgi:choline dehydrogenase-like flavoprotein